MENKKSRKKELDEFWNISELLPKTNAYNRPILTDETDIKGSIKNDSNRDIENVTVIKRYIPPHGGENLLSKKNNFVKTESYIPDSSLIHNVVIKKYKTEYNYYGGFLNDGVKYMNVRGEPCEYVPFFSYVPQYDQMNDKQLAYYFWFRDRVIHGEFIKTDYGYLFLYIYELINLGTRLDVKKTQSILVELWNKYSDEFPAITTRLGDWICDFSLLHRLPPPASGNTKIIQKILSLKEFFIDLPPNDLNRCARTLMTYCSSYDYRTSKFYTSQNSRLFDEHIMGSLISAIKYYSTGERILSGIEMEDSTVSRDTYAGALCVADEKYRIEVSYCSFSRSNELRFLIGDIIKYSENKLRTYFGVKSKMTVYSINSEIREVIDGYFLQNLPAKQRHIIKTEKHDYDVLYDVPKKPLSISLAAKIEERSWLITKELVEAFDDDDHEDSGQPAKDIIGTDITDSDIADNDKESDVDADAFANYRPIIIALINEDKTVLDAYAQRTGKMTDVVVDEINEIACEKIGDILIEETNSGRYCVIEDYRDIFTK